MLPLLSFRSITLKTIYRNRKNEDWNEWDQMDAHELLRYLLDGVSMEEVDVGLLLFSFDL